MNVLFAIRNDYLTKLGGDSIQLLKTKEYLEKLHDITIKVVTDYREIKKYHDYPITHVFNLQTITETTNFINESKMYNKKVVLSTIYWNFFHSNFVTLYFRLTGTIVGAKYFKWLEKVYRKLSKFIPFSDIYLSRKYRKSRIEAIIKSDLLLPNSNEELECIAEDFSLDVEVLKSKSIIVPNAFDLSLTSKESDFSTLKGVNGYVLMVGRLEPFKNQLGVLLALFDFPEIPIVFVGKTNNVLYRRKLEKLAKKRKNVYFIENVEHSEIYNLYKRAAVHVLPSFRESPGLVTLEALSSGCKVVVASREYCPVDYYCLDKIAEICDPYDINSIRDCIIRSIKKEKTYIDINHFTYENVANITFNAYKLLCD